MGQALRNIGIVSGVTMLSRVLGLGREMAIAAVFGASALASAFVTAFTMPNLFRRLLGEGALTSALVPTLQEETRRRGPEGAAELVSEVATWVLIATASICAVAMLALAGQGWWGPRLVEAGWAEGTVARWTMGARLGVVLFPYMVMVCLAAVFSAALQTRERFLEPALNPVWLNLAMIGLLLAGVLAAPGEPAARMNWLCVGVLLGGAMQMLVPALALARLGWRPRWAPVRSEGVRQIARLMVPTLFGSAIYLVNTTLSRLFGLSIDDAAATMLNLSTRVMELPIGVFAIAVSTVVFPLIARHAAEGRMDALAEDYRKGMRLILLINVPAAAGMMVLAEPLVRVLFERGAFTADDTRMMAPVLAASVAALPFLAYASLALRAFYARKDTRTPVRAACWSFLVNVAASLVLMRGLGATGLALASTLAVVTQAVYLQVHLARENQGLAFRHLGGHLAKVVAASAAMAGAVAGAAWGWRGLVEPGGWTDAAGLGLMVALGAGVFFATAWILRVEGRDEFAALLKRKLRRR
jgi:putative peptidoglycan lipid II flippase